MCRSPTLARASSTSQRAAVVAATASQIHDHAFDGNGNRISLTRTTWDLGTGCPSVGSGTVRTSRWSYGGADKLTIGFGGGSYVYGGFGRATTIPEGDTPLAATGASRGAVSLGYYDDDSIRERSPPRSSI
jgi:hypothetical protein